MKLPDLPLPPIVVCVDPGVYRCGLAVFFDGALIHCSEPDASAVGCSAFSTAEYVVRTAKTAIERALGPDIIYTAKTLWVAETPQTYAGKEGRENTLDLLRAVISEIGLWRWDSGVGRTVFTVTPHAWKGNVPKNIHHGRIVAAMTKEERAVVWGCTRTRDALDAVGLGMFVLRRLGRGGKAPIGGM